MSRWFPRFTLAALALPFALTAQAGNNPHYRATLNGVDELPVNASPAGGTALIEFDTSDNTLKIQAEFADLLGKTTGARLDASPGRPMTALLSGFPVGVKSGKY